jgi:hypothetical protein
VKARILKQVFTALLVLLLILLGITFFFPDSKRDRNELPIVFLGHTTDVAGTRRAIFSVTNTHDRTIRFRTWTETKASTGWPAGLADTGVSWVLPGGGIYPIAPGTNSHFAIVVHSNDITWRVVFHYEKSTTRRDDLFCPLQGLFYSLRLNSIARRIPCEKNYDYIIYGPEIQETLHDNR